METSFTVLFFPSFGRPSTGSLLVFRPPFKSPPFPFFGSLFHLTKLPFPFSGDSLFPGSEIAPPPFACFKPLRVLFSATPRSLFFTLSPQAATSFSGLFLQRMTTLFLTDPPFLWGFPPPSATKLFLFQSGGRPPPPLSEIDPLCQCFARLGFLFCRYSAANS